MKAAPQPKIIAQFSKARTTDDSKQIADGMREKIKAHGMMNEISSGTIKKMIFIDTFLTSQLPFKDSIGQAF